MLHLRPDLVHRDRIVDDLPPHLPGYDLLPIPDDFTVASGILSGATELAPKRVKWLGVRLWRICINYSLQSSSSLSGVPLLYRGVNSTLR